MLSALTIQNIVLIEKLSLNFQAGFNALTGETGAGKSILLDSLGLALGSRAEASLVRKDCDKGVVTATFEIDSTHPVFNILEDQDLQHDGEVILRRVLSADGKSRAFINDQPVSVGLLREVGQSLVEIHGQFDTHGLLDPKTHRAMLDDYAGIDLEAIKTHWKNWKEAGKKLRAARETLEKAKAEEEYLRQALEDIDKLSPEEGEEETLATLRERLMRREQVIEALNFTDQGIGEAENTISGLFRAVEKTGEDGTELCSALERASAELQEASSQIRRIYAHYDESEYSLEDIDDRLFGLRAQARKHGCTPDELPNLREDLAQRLNMIETQDDMLAALAKEEENAKAVFVKSASDNHQKRKEIAAKLDGLVAAELPPLKMEKARFLTEVVLQDNESDWGEHGMDDVRFVVATNPGSAPGPLNKIASGGELARFTLALKVIMAEVGAAGSLIFDEVDTGIGGSTAAAVGERLARLSLSRQILVVTHSPQVAARASHHYIVMKSGDEDMRTAVIPLSEIQERREEIARMLSGAFITEEARKAAERLLETGT